MKTQTVSATPLASSMIETFRAIGYNLQTAIADIIDNSISASARNIRVHFEWAGEKSWVTITDDGTGMNDAEIINAMRPGSRSPLAERDPKDLGRFGLGLKTASFSQCRKLTVISKKNDGAMNYWTWDLDYVIESEKWELIRIEPDGKHLTTLSKQQSGTIIVWEDIDRLVKGSNSESDKDLERFLNEAKTVKAHLAMVFHRFIEQSRLKLFFNGELVEAWDPYLKGEKATQPLPDEPIGGGKVRVKAYILPHISKITKEVHTRAEGPAGWNAQQGFYIYRNDRMLVAGSWLGMYRKEEHYKLARIMVDIPNSLDHEWQIDIKKSVARPPAAIYTDLKRIANFTRGEAVKIYRHRGKVLQRNLQQDFVMVWQEKTRHGKRFYEVNRDHPAWASLQEDHPLAAKHMEKFLRMLEETVPVPLIALRESERPDAQLKPFEQAATKELEELLKLMYATLCKQMPPSQAKQQLHFIEPFSEYPEMIEKL
jgi:hypothetical protein